MLKKFLLGISAAAILAGSATSVAAASSNAQNSGQPGGVAAKSSGDGVCLPGQNKIMLPNGTERSCVAAKPTVKKPPNFFGYTMIALVASDWAFVAAKMSKGRPASP